jgi:hypothetical protein
MSRTLSLAMLVAAFAQETGEAIIPLVTVTHTELSETFRVAMTGADLVSRGNTFYALPFDLVIPDDSPDRPPQATITVDNIDRRFTAAMESTTVPAEITIEIVRGSSPDTVEASWSGLTLKEVKYNMYTVSGTLTYEAIAKESYPKGAFSPGYFPGMF